MARMFEEAELLERVDNDTAFLADTVEMLAADGPTLLEQLHAALASADAAAVGRTAHAIKGMVSNFCAPNVQAVALEVEKLGKSADLLASRRSLRAFKEMNFVLVPDSQPTKPIEFFDYPDESDLDGGTFPYGHYPIPTNMPVETWPSETSGQTLTQWQQDVKNWGGDRHSIIVKPGAGRFQYSSWPSGVVLVMKSGALSSRSCRCRTSASNA